MSAHVDTETTHGRNTARRASGEPFGWLRLMGMPGFALLALMTGLANDGQANILCAATTSPLGGMVPMYVLMSVIHATSWIQMVARIIGCKPGDCRNAC